eukprot:2564704-Pyramimonas_sp.AAC.1
MSEGAAAAKAAAEAKAKAAASSPGSCTGTGGQTPGTPCSGAGALASTATPPSSAKGDPRSVRAKKHTQCHKDKDNLVAGFKLALKAAIECRDADGVDPVLDKYLLSNLSQRIDLMLKILGMEHKPSETSDFAPAYPDTQEGRARNVSELKALLAEMGDLEPVDDVESCMTESAVTIEINKLPGELN